MLFDNDYLVFILILVGSIAVAFLITMITFYIRQQDVRATEIDKVDMYLCFHPGDIVKAQVFSLGDAQAYYLSTAKDELGVVSAESIGDVLKNKRRDGCIIEEGKRVDIINV